MAITACAVGCGFSEGPGARESAPRAAEPVPVEEHVGAESARARAIREAEAFVRAQGYTDAPASVSGDAVVREGIEGGLEDRRGQLEPRALDATEHERGVWTVTFRYAIPEHRARGRQLTLRPGEPPRFTHQDLVLEPDAERAGPADLGSRKGG